MRFDFLHPSGLICAEGLADFILGVCVSCCTCVGALCLRKSEESVGSLKLEVKAVVTSLTWVLGTELRLL